jgi:hypothetical protein
MEGVETMQLMDQIWSKMKTPAYATGTQTQKNPAAAELKIVRNL